MAFDPDAYLAKKSAPTGGASGSFDPDAYLEKTKTVTEEEKPLISGRRLLKGTLEALPTAGALAGGAIGTMAGPIGTFGGAGLGAGAGKALQNLGEKYLLDEEKTREDIYAGPAKATLEGVTAEMGGAAATKGIEKAAKFAMEKVAPSLTRVPKKAIDTYLRKGEGVDKLIKEYGGDSQAAANAVREDINKEVQAFKGRQNAKITKALTDNEDIVSVQKTIDALEEMKSKFDPDFNADKITKIQQNIDKITTLAPEGDLPVKKAFALQKNLQEQADYLEPGQIFKKRGLIDTAFEKAASETRKVVNNAAPGIADANKELQKLRRIEKSMHKGLLKEGAPEASLIAAGADESGRGARSLGMLDEAVGAGKILPQVEDLAAQKYFADPGILPGYNTGAATIPLLLGGAYAGKEALEGDFAGAGKGLLLGAAGSPLALKYGIQAARPLMKGWRAAEPMLRQLPKGLIDGK